MKAGSRPQTRALLGKLHESLALALERIKRHIDVITMFGIWAAAIVGAWGIWASGSDAEKQRELISQQLKTMTDQAVTLDKQATLAAQQLPRAWLYVEFPNLAARQAHKVQSAQGSSNTEKPYWQFHIPFQVTNYGQIPGTIIRVQAFVYLGAPSQHGSRPEVPMTPDGRTLEGYVIGESEEDDRRAYDGRNIAAGKSLFPPEDSFDLERQTLTFDVPRREDITDDLNVLPLWIRIEVTYEDPNGQERATHYFGQLVAASRVVEYVDPRYSFHH
jgi:hypothetical protein